MNDNLGAAVAAIRSSKLRSTLTAAIIAVGIMSLVGIQTSIEILSRELTESFGKMGAEMQRIESIEKAPPITLRQALEFAGSFPGSSVSAVAFPVAEAASGGLRTDPVATVVASDANYLYCNGLHLDCGRIFSQNEMLEKSHVCIIGKSISDRLFGDGNAVGEAVSFGAGEYRVIGVLKKRGAMFGGGSDCSIVIPLGSAVSGSGNHTVSFISKKGETDSETAAMRRIRGLAAEDDDDFVIRGGDTAAVTLAGLKSKLSAAALVIGLITLLGASVGLMNTMLVSVKERKSETGLRKAVGADNSSIRNQFLAEALILGLCGGLAGICLGISAGGCVALALGGRLAVPWNWIGISLALCIIVSIASGLLPARRAASLPPVEALREE